MKKGTRRCHISYAISHMKYGISAPENGFAVEMDRIGIGRDLTAPPSPTTVHTAPYTAVRIVMLYSLKPGFGYSTPPRAIRSLRQQLPGLHLGSPLRSPVLTVDSAACHA